MARTTSSRTLASSLSISNSAITTPGRRREFYTEESPLRLSESCENRQRLQAILNKSEDDRTVERLRPSDYGVTPRQPIASLFQNNNIKQCDYLTHLEGLRKGVSKWDFINVPVKQTTYKRLEPALRLATKWLIDSEPFYIKTIFAEQSYNTLDEKILFLDPDYEQNNHDRKTYLDLLPFLLERTTFCMGRITNSTIRARECCAHGVCSIHYIKDSFVITVQINAAYLNFYSRRDYNTLDPRLKRRVDFLFATTVGHEMAHAMMHLRRIINQPVRVPLKEEPSYDIQHPQRELGRAWEQWMFGGFFATLTSAKEANDPVHHLTKIAEVVRVNWKEWIRFGEEEVGYSPPVKDEILELLFETGKWAWRQERGR